MRRIAMILLLLLMLVLSRVTFAESTISSKAQLNQSGMKVGVSTGSASVLIAEKELPNAQLMYYEDDATGYEAVAQGKLDAYIFERVQMQMAIDNGRKGVHLLDENMGETVKIAVGISPKSSIPDIGSKLNAFIDELRESGTLKDMFHRWVETGDLTMPDIALPKAPKYHLTVGTAGVVPPYSYYVGSTLNGYDIELAKRFAAWLDADLTFKVYDFTAIIAAATSGDVDCIMSNLNVTPERMEVMPFSDILYESPIGIMVRGEAPDSRNKTATSFTSVDALNGQLIGSATGTTYDDIVRRRLPDAAFLYYDSYSDMVAALRSGKIAGFACDEPVLKTIIAENSDVTMLPEYLDTFALGFIFSKDERGGVLCDQMSEFIREIRSSGEWQTLDDKWFNNPMDQADMPNIRALNGENGTLTLATNAMNPPFNYMRKNGYAGFEIELAIRFCERYGYSLTIQDMDFSAILTSVKTGKADFGASSITVTEERAQSVRFSEPHYSGGTVIAVLKSDAESTKDPQTDGYTALDQLDGSQIGVQTGTTAEGIARARLPHIQISEFSTFPDMAVALETHKIDGFIGDGLVLLQMAQENPNLKILDERLNSYECGFVLAKSKKGRALCEEINAWIHEMRELGELDRILKKWTEAPESERTMPDYRSLPAPKGILTMTTEGTFPPMNYYRDGECVGMEIELCAMFCKACGYGLNVTTMDFGSGMLAAVQAGKVDFAISGIAITEERQQSVLFSDPYYTGGMRMAVLKGAGEPSAAGISKTGGSDPDGENRPSFMDGIVSSFEKTFNRENRWQLFVRGILTTLTITIASILFGTLIGFLVFMLCRNGNPFANRITRFCLWLVQGMPMVVLLMILYYIVFGSISISGVLVAVIGFTLTFGSAVFGLLKMGVGAVDGGQYEAAYALGYSNWRTFFRIILPQALPHVLPAYRGEIVGLIKATAVVGYIAVQDLTKMGDIVRSRTYEAFFPLIAVTVIYFVLEGAINLLVRCIEVHLNPRRRRPEDILKGVKTDD